MTCKALKLNSYENINFTSYYNKLRVSDFTTLGAIRDLDGKLKKLTTGETFTPIADIDKRKFTLYLCSPGIEYEYADSEIYKCKKNNKQYITATYKFKDGRTFMIKVTEGNIVWIEYTNSDKDIYERIYNHDHEENNYD